MSTFRVRPARAVQDAGACGPWHQSRGLGRRPRLRSAAVLAVAAAGMLTLLAAPAAAAPPANDRVGQATALTLPSRIVQNTAAATFDPATEPTGCFGELGTVWFRFRPASTVDARITTLGSGYDTLTEVYLGRPSAETLLACRDDDIGVHEVVSMRFEAGRTYFISVRACCGALDKGGRLVLSLYSPRKLTASATVDAAAAGLISGRAYVTGTMRCSNPSQGLLYVTLSQRLGNEVARGYGYVRLDLCVAGRRTWTAAVDGTTHLAFQPGPALAIWSASAHDGVSGVEIPEQRTTVTLTTDPNGRAHRSVG